MELIKGPWKNIFKGDWDGYEIEVKENPEKIILTLVYEKEKTGVISIINKFYYAQGNVSRLMDEFKNYSLLIEKQFPTHKSLFFSLSSGPRYSSLELLNETIENSFKTVEQESEELNEKTKIYSINLTELKHAKIEVQKDLLSDPLMLSGLLSRKTNDLQVMTSSVKVLLGKKTKGEEAEEEIDSFLNTLIVGEDDEIKKAVHVILENAVLAGKVGIVLDNDDSFSKMNYPNRDFNFNEYKQMQPIGMPIKHVEVNDLGINLKKLNEKILLEVFALDSKKFIDEKTRKIITSAYNESKKELESLENLEEKVATITDETKKFYIYRAVRWLKVLEKRYPNYFKGKTEYKKLIPTYSKSMGSVIRIDVKNQPKVIKKALVYSLAKSMMEEFKERGASSQLKTITCLIDSSSYLPLNPKKEVEQELVKVFSDSLNYGIGLCGGAETEMDVNESIVEKNTMKISFISKKEVAVKGRNSRPYRIKIRENLTS